jgi:guanyl-specific ribonuclease Sa
MKTIDELAAQATSELWKNVGSHIDIEASLADLHSNTSSVRTSSGDGHKQRPTPARRYALIGSAALVAASIAAVAVIVSRDDRGSVTPATTVETTDASQTTIPQSSAPPSSSPASSTTGIDPSTTAPPSTTTPSLPTDNAANLVEIDTGAPERPESDYVTAAADTQREEGYDPGQRRTLFHAKAPSQAALFGMLDVPYFVPRNMLVLSVESMVTDGGVTSSGSAFTSPWRQFEYMVVPEEGFVGRHDAMNGTVQLAANQTPESLRDSFVDGAQATGDYEVRLYEAVFEECCGADPRPGFGAELRAGSVVYRFEAEAQTSENGVYVRLARSIEDATITEAPIPSFVVDGIVERDQAVEGVSGARPTKWAAALGGGEERYYLGWRFDGSPSEQAELASTLCGSLGYVAYGGAAFDLDPEFGGTCVYRTSADFVGDDLFREWNFGYDDSTLVVLLTESPLPRWGG